MPRRLERPATRTQFVALFLLQLSNFRWSWRGMLITGMIAPLLTVASLGAFAEDPANLSYVLCGSIVLSLMFQNQNNVAGNFAYMKAMGTLDFFATLPIHRSLVVVATVLAFFLLSVPSLIVTTVLGVVILGVGVHLSWWAILVVPLCVLPLAGIGAFVGVQARTPEAAGATSILLTFLLLFFGPVIVPPDRLPDWSLALGHVSPTTYASSAVRQVVVGPVTGRLWLDLGVLVLVTAVTLWGVGHRMPWHQR
ncbi:hypothetical protein GCM10022243_34690 [Saccharothrix violaceirubra]|uniref:ABC-2 type transport system permease protein n=1 Tax=Saccharothrix violaceirubra TaxID=413306 RepID=A0A7W7T597_9PSEU|nr:ABC transporter permease [Saccharothrix violaceirubra]MBB4966521.1 ABC-2 type transport system permease protein [Saccharothrix violaceirubra]